MNIRRIHFAVAACSASAALIWLLTGHIVLGAVSALLVMWAAAGLRVVGDNSARPIYWFGWRLYRCVESGLRWYPWPVLIWGAEFDNSDEVIEAEVNDIPSNDRVPFGAHIQFLYRFRPVQVTNRELLAQLLAKGHTGRKNAARQAARATAIDVMRQNSSFSLSSGRRQTAIQDHIARAIAARLSDLGLEVAIRTVSVTFTTPPTLRTAYIDQQSAIPESSASTYRLGEMARLVRQLPEVEMRQFLELIIADRVGETGVDPLSALLVRRLLRHDDQP